MSTGAQVIKSFSSALMSPMEMNGGVRIDNDFLEYGLTSPLACRSASNNYLFSLGGLPELTVAETSRDEGRF